MQMKVELQFADSSGIELVVMITAHIFVLFSGKNSI